jgi:hypothetical protein
MGRGVRLTRFGMGLLAGALAAMPAVAQDNAVATNNSAPTEVIGPPQLRDFSLNGTVTRQATPPATTRATPPATRPATTPAPTTTRQSTRPTAAEPLDRVPNLPAEPAVSRPVAQQPTVVERQAPVADAAPETPLTRIPETQLPGESGSGFTLWPWLLAGLAAAGAALYLFRRNQQQRARYQAAGVGAVDLGDALHPEQPTEPLHRAPVAVPPARPASTGIISSRLRPDLDIELLPERAVVDENGATIEFHVAVRNNGSAPARDVHVEACIVNAGPAQDQELGAFFAHPGARGNPIPQINPMTEITLKSTVRLPPDLMRGYEVEGRKLFVPLVGVNALYRGPAGPAQTSASYLVGRDGKGEKMAPFRLDLGPRIFRGLGVRPHTMGLRT